MVPIMHIDKSLTLFNIINQLIPISKHDNPSNLSISILPTVSKVLERILTQQNFYLLSKILSEFQFGYWQDHSSITALVKICDDIHFYAKDENLIIVLILLYCFKAFGCFNLDVLRSIDQSNRRILRSSLISHVVLLFMVCIWI